MDELHVSETIPLYLASIFLPIIHFCFFVFLFVVVVVVVSEYKKHRESREAPKSHPHKYAST